MIGWLSKEKKWFVENKLYICALFVVTAIFSLLYFNRFAPDTMGWQLYNAILMENGDMVYRDFFNYLPPGSLLRTIWAYTLTNGSILGYRFICILERVFLALLIFKILSRFYKRKFAWIATVTGIILTATTVVDQFGDYNQTYKVYLLLGVCFGMKFFDSNCIKKKENISLFMFGGCLGMVMLFKHSIGLIAPACFFLMLFVYCVIEKKKDFFRYAMLSIAGYILPVGLCSIWLIANNAFMPFVEQVFGSAAAKGDSTTLVLRFWKNIFKPDCLAIFCAIGLNVWISKLKVFGNKKLIQNGIRICTAYFVLKKFGGYIGYLINAIDETNTWYIFYAVILCSGLIGYRFLRKSNVKKDENLFVYVTGILTFVAIYLVTCLDAESLTILYNNSLFFKAKEDLPVFSAYIVVGLLFLSFGYYILKRKTLYSFNYMLMLVGFFAIMYESGMATGTTGLTYIVACIGIPLMICVGFQINTSHNAIKNTVILGICIFVCMFSMIQKYTQPYSWWGWKDPTIDEECQYSIDVPRMGGFRVARSTKITYEQINKLIIENSNGDNFVLTFPHMKLFNIISNRMEAPTFVVSYYFDVCPDEYAIKDAEIIRENPPKIVIMNTYDESFWEYNENAFRGGEFSGQREILRWFEEKRNDYILIGYVNGLEIYSLQDGRPVEYTYFEDEDTDLIVEPCEDNAFSIVDIVLTQMKIQSENWNHAKYTFLIVILFIGILGTYFLRENWFESGIWIATLVSMCVKTNPLYALIYIFNIVIYFEGKRTRQEKKVDIILIGGMCILITCAIISFIVDTPVIKIVRIIFSIVLCSIMLFKILDKIIKEKIRVKYVVFTVICIALFLASQVFFSSTAWWDIYMNKAIMSDSDSLKLFSIVCFTIWTMGILLLSRFKCKRKGD